MEKEHLSLHNGGKKVVAQINLLCKKKFLLIKI
jgi:hypothetical protein